MNSSKANSQTVLAAGNDVPPGAPPPKTSFQVTTFRKLARGQTGLTKLVSDRLALGDVLDWVLAELPEDAITITSHTEGEEDRVVVEIDWNKVPWEIRDGRR